MLRNKTIRASPEAYGGLNYASLSISDKDTNQSVKTNQFSFKFNSADISLKLYF